jgi:hypothetical protein
MYNGKRFVHVIPLGLHNILTTVLANQQRRVYVQLEQ